MTNTKQLSSLTLRKSQTSLSACGTIGHDKCCQRPLRNPKGPGRQTRTHPTHGPNHYGPSKGQIWCCDYSETQTDIRTISYWHPDAMLSDPKELFQVAWTEQAKY